MLKAAFGIVLPKPNKPSYAEPSFFQVVVLLQTISKILKRIIAVRLFNHALSNNLIHPNQFRSLAGLRVNDAAITLFHEIKSHQAAQRKVSTVFLDVKGGFDHIVPRALVSRLQKHNTPAYMISWILSFLTERTCCLICNGSPRSHTRVDVGSPQGSPISHLLFVIYVAPFHFDLHQGITLSYVDNFKLFVASNSYRSNIISRQRAWSKIKSAAAAVSVTFSCPKTDLIH